MNPLSGKLGLLTAIAGSILMLDQGTKLVVKDTMMLHQSIPVIPGLFHLTYIQNSGAAFGVFAEAPALFRVSFLIGISVLALAVLGFLYWRVPKGREEVLIPLAMIMGGASGNLIDRLYQQKVVDFLDFFWRGHHWPSFNVADSAITMGAILLMAVSLYSGKGDLFTKDDKPCER